MWCVRASLFYYHASPPYKPFFTNNPNDKNKLNGVCIYKHGDDESKTKWIRAGFQNVNIVPRCQITFQTNNNKIINVKIENKKDENSESIYTISLNEGEVEKITKEGEEVNNADCIEEINNTLFKDDINKVLIERIEDELDEQQKVVFDKIKEHLDLVKEKEAEKENNTKIIDKDINKEGGNENKNNTSKNTNINNETTCFGLYTNERGEKIWSCFGYDIPCL